MFDLNTIKYLNEVAEKNATLRKTAPLILTDASDLLNKVPVPIPFVSSDGLRSKAFRQKLNVKYSDFKSELAPAESISDFKHQLSVLIRTFGKVYVGITGRSTSHIEVSVWSD